MSSNTSLIVAVSLCFIAASCNQSEDPYAPVYSKFSELEFIELKLDENKFKDIHPDKYQIISDSTNDGLYHVTIFGDSLLAVTDQFKSMKLFELSSGNALNEFEFVGNGPGEYNFIMDLVADSNHIVLFDGPSFKINRYTKNLEPIDQHGIVGINAFGNIDYKYPYLVYSLSNNENKLFQIINLDNPSDLKSFHNRIISIGKHPSGYNGAKVSISPNNNLAILSGNMPLLFIYGNGLFLNNEESGYLIRLRHDDLNLIGKPLKTQFGGAGTVIENPPPIEFDLPEGKIIGTTPLFQDVVMVNEWIFINESLNNRLIVLNFSGNSIKHHASYRLLNEKGVALKWGSISYSNDWVFLGSSQGVFRIQMSDLIRN